MCRALVCQCPDYVEENFGLLRRILGKRRQPEQSWERGAQTKRLKAAWDEGYLLKILTT